MPKRCSPACKPPNSRARSPSMFWWNYCVVVIPTRFSISCRSPHRRRSVPHSIPGLPSRFPTSWPQGLRQVLPPPRFGLGWRVNPLPFRLCHRRTRTPLAVDRAASLSLTYSTVANNNHQAHAKLTTMRPTRPPDPNDTIPKAVSFGTARCDDPARTTRPDPMPSARATPHPGSASDAYGHISRVSRLTVYSKTSATYAGPIGPLLQVHWLR